MRNRVLTTAALKLSHRLFFFAITGASAACVHLLIVLNLVASLSVPPLIANIIAFLIAFNVSFLGHKYMTFSRLQDAKQLSLPHFFLVASSAGILNEFLYYLFLKYSHLNYMIALIIVLGLVSIYSYFFSRFWACR